VIKLNGDEDDDEYGDEQRDKQESLSVADVDQQSCKSFQVVPSQISHKVDSF